MSRGTDLTGQRFGMLVVVEKMEETQERYNLWLCHCDCGGEIKVNTKRLKRGTITNCGCIPKQIPYNGPVAEDLTGQRFGNLVALYRAKNRQGRTVWVCRCDCGRLHTTRAYELKAGKCKSCGCQTHKTENYFVDIAGQRFGRLTALHITERRDKKGWIIWHCRCDCGNEVDVSADGLMHGNYKSCGCRREEVWKNIPNQRHLIDGTCLECLEKRKHRSDNTSGFRGVSKTKSGRYKVGIGFKGARYHVGTFSSFNEAVQARLEVEELIHDGFVKAYYAWTERKEADPAWAEKTPLTFEVRKTNGYFEVITNMEAKP